ncbi:MAG: DUF2255 family protein [Acidimicrobiia bacterium]
MSLTPEDLTLIAGANEVVVETRSGDRVVRTVIWVVVDGEDVFVRSVLGRAGRWWQRALAEPEVTLSVGDIRFRFTATPVTDPESVERTSEGFRRKYRKGRSLDAMLRPEVLDTTLLLETLV